MKYTLASLSLHVYYYFWVRKDRINTRKYSTKSSFFKLMIQCLLISESRTNYCRAIIRIVYACAPRSPVGEDVDKGKDSLWSSRTAFCNCYWPEYIGPWPTFLIENLSFTPMICSSTESSLVVGRIYPLGLVALRIAPDKDSIKTFQFFK